MNLIKKKSFFQSNKHHNSNEKFYHFPIMNPTIFNQAKKVKENSKSLKRIINHKNNLFENINCFGLLLKFKKISKQRKHSLKNKNLKKTLNKFSTKRNFKSVKMCSKSDNDKYLTPQKQNTKLISKCKTNFLLLGNHFKIKNKFLNLKIKESLSNLGGKSNKCKPTDIKKFAKKTELSPSFIQNNQTSSLCLHFFDHEYPLKKIRKNPKRYRLSSKIKSDILLVKRSDIEFNDHQHELPKQNKNHSCLEIYGLLKEIQLKNVISTRSKNNSLNLRKKNQKACNIFQENETNIIFNQNTVTYSSSSFMSDKNIFNNITINPKTKVFGNILKSKNSLLNFFDS
jgi:hypothetical protein